jgi:hypothetical protein
VRGFAVYKGMTYYQSDQRQGDEIGRTSSMNVKYEEKIQNFRREKGMEDSIWLLLFIYLS